LAAPHFLVYRLITIMEYRILGLHHLTAIASDPQRNYDFYAKVLGLRFIKKTVNFDDPGTYHFYFGDEVGSAGTILTFFPWPHITRGRRGPGQATEISYSVPAGSLDFWMRRFDEQQVSYTPPSERFGEQYLTFPDPDGLQLELVVSKTPDDRTPWATPEVGADVATRGFHCVTLTLASREATAAILTDIFGYQLIAKEGNRYRYATDAVASANLIDLMEVGSAAPSITAGGTVHHVAFRVKNDATLMQFRARVAARGLNITPQIDRQYFHSLYFREPGGVLFEIATDNPGFMVDEPLAELGTHLLLPHQYEARRWQIEERLPKLV
jgi:glyoxalase family protein